MYQATFIIVEMGEAAKVMEVAEEHGAQGGTIIRGRGAGSGEANRVLNIEIEPEKDILILVTEEENTEQIVEQVSDYLDVEHVNSGIILTMNLSDTRGLY